MILVWWCDDEKRRFDTPRTHFRVTSLCSRSQTAISIAVQPDIDISTGLLKSCNVRASRWSTDTGWTYSEIRHQVMDLSLKLQLEHRTNELAKASTTISYSETPGSAVN